MVTILPLLNATRIRGKVDAEGDAESHLAKEGGIFGDTFVKSLS